MSVEKFETDQDPSTTLVIAVYNDGTDIIPSWWLEILEQKYKHIAEIEAMLDVIPGIVSRLEEFVERCK